MRRGPATARAEEATDGTDAKQRDYEELLARQQARIEAELMGGL